MKNRTSEFDLAMVTRKFYCHKCGERLLRNARTRTIKRGDPDYRKHARFANGTYSIGDIELTEYDFKCWTCDRIINPDEQYVIEQMQKMLGKHILSDEEFAENEEKARAAIAKKRKITEIVVKAVSITVLLLVLFLWITNGGTDFTFYF